MARRWLKLSADSAGWFCGIKVRMQGMENLPVNGRLPKSMLNDMHNEELQARAAAWDEAHPREEEFDEL